MPQKKQLWKTMEQVWNFARPHNVFLGADWPTLFVVQDFFCRERTWSKFAACGPFHSRCLFVLSPTMFVVHFVFLTVFSVKLFFLFTLSCFDRLFLCFIMFYHPHAQNKGPDLYALLCRGMKKHDRTQKIRRSKQNKVNKRTNFTEKKAVKNTKWTTNIVGDSTNRHLEAGVVSTSTPFLHTHTLFCRNKNTKTSIFADTFGFKVWSFCRCRPEAMSFCKKGPWFFCRRAPWVHYKLDHPNPSLFIYFKEDVSCCFFFWNILNFFFNILINIFILKSVCDVLDATLQSMGMYGQW